MSEPKLPNPTPQPEKPDANPTMPPDPLLESGSSIEPKQPDPAPELQQTENVAFASGSVIAAQPISVMAPGESTPRKAGRVRSSDPEEMAKRPSWLPEDWRMELKTRTSGSTAGVIDRYYYGPLGGRKFRSKNEVIKFLERGSKSKNNSKSKTDDGPSESPASQKQNKRKSNSKTDAEPSGTSVNGKQKKSRVKRKKSDDEMPQPEEMPQPQEMPQEI